MASDKNSSPAFFWRLLVRKIRLFSYVVEHDEGHAPNPHFRICTLCRCKFRKSPKGRRNIVELAQPGDWVIGTGGANPLRSAGRGKLVYAMQVEEKLTRQQYYEDNRFERKKPLPSGSYDRKHGDNERPTNPFEKHCQFALISHRFYYFRRNAICIDKKKFPDLEKTGRGFRSHFEGDIVKQFVKWITRHKLGKQGDPCMKETYKEGRKQACKSSC